MADLSWFSKDFKDLGPGDIHDIEALSFEDDKDCVINRATQRLCLLVRHLQHELKDPNYLYSGRICRQALITRDAQIDVLLKQMEQLKKDNLQLIQDKAELETRLQVLLNAKEQMKPKVIATHRPGEPF